ncbi:hypothetical protein SAY86_020276 [Trapa natans]|uniref:Late embryogenesis abundant protein D-29 n=1 Tax=Trapa natans TaxID=22666 RepID=A0AAN7R417_TRANT|nr:hypothetical protein SAY86_020276 [Trapa natans]
MTKGGFVPVLMVMLVIMAVYTEEGWCWRDEAKEKMNMAADWARDRFSGVLGSKQDITQDMMDKAGDAASKATGTLNSAASDSSEYISEKVGEMGSYTSEKGKEATRSAFDKANEAKESVEHMVRHGKDEESANSDSAELAEWNSEGMEEAYEEALKRVGQSYGAAKDTMAEGAKSTHEAAKETASEATGNLGEEMRKGMTEL